MSKAKSKLSLNLLHKLFIFSEPYNNTCVKKALTISRLKYSWVGFVHTPHPLPLQVISRMLILVKLTQLFAGFQCQAK